MNLKEMLVILPMFVFVVIVWNLILPLSSAQNADFIHYMKYVFVTNYEQSGYAQQYVEEPILRPSTTFFTDLSNNQDTDIAFGPRHLHDNTTHYVTLTFYIEYGNHHYLPDLIDLLHSYEIEKAVFLVEKGFIDDRPFAMEAIKQAGYTVVTLNSIAAYDTNYAPTVFQGMALSDREMFAYIQKDYIASDFFDIALHNQNASIVAFTPKIIEHSMILEDILKHNGRSLVFLDSNITNAKNVYDLEYAKGSNGLAYFTYSPKFTKFTEHRPSTPIKLEHGAWTVQGLNEKYPSDIVYMSSKHGYLINRPIIVEKNAALKVVDNTIFLRSSTQKNNSPVYMEIKGRAIISNSTITSWDPTLTAQDPNPYHPRPYVLARDGGKMDIIESTISHLGYSLGGFGDTRYARAAISYYNTNDFIIANSTIAFNYYGFYSAHASNFQIIGNKIYGQTRYGLDPHTYSTDFIVDSNHVHDNGNQGIICSLHCKNVIVTNNIVEYNVEGIGLHWLTNSSLVKDNIVRYNEKYGIFIQKESFNNIVKDNLVVGNKAGIGLLEGSNANIVTSNTVVDNLEAIRIESDSTSNLVKENRFSFEATVEYQEETE